MVEFQCPNCQQFNECEEGQPPPDYQCDHCGVRFRLERKGSRMRCEGCGSTCECEDCFESVAPKPWCWAESQHNWESTLAVDMEKCSNCNMVRRLSAV